RSIPAKDESKNFAGRAVLNRGVHSSFSRKQTSSIMSQTLIQPYLFFNGRCEEAVEFYRQALGADVRMVMRYKESPEPPPPGMVPDGWGEKIMHAAFTVAGNLVMA